MDEMRWILYSHGGMDPLILSCWFDVLCTRWLLLWQRGSGTVSSSLRAFDRPAIAYVIIRSKLLHPFSAMLERYVDAPSVSLKRF